MMRKRTWLALTALAAGWLAWGCSGAPEGKSAAGRVVFQPRPDGDGSIKILLYYDMEGISGQNDIRSLSFGNPEYEQARIWLTNDVNAVIEGLYAGGADVVDVVDAHGSGNPRPDILEDCMDRRVQLLSRDRPFRPYVDLLEEAAYDAVVVVCMHSGTGGGGFAAHTYTLGMKWIFNDMPINETEIIAYSWGRAGIPVIFASGDDRLKQQLEWMTWLEYVTVKTARGAGDAELRPFEEVHAEMTAAAERAVGSLENARAVRLTEPIKAQLNAVHPAGLEILEGVPGIDYRDRTVTFQAGDFLEAYNGVEALIGVATTRYMHLLQGVVRRQGDARAIFQDFAAELTKAWVEMESGERRPPSSPAAKAEPGAYFGVR